MGADHLEILFDVARRVLLYESDTHLGLLAEKVSSKFNDGELHTASREVRPVIGKIKVLTVLQVLISYGRAAGSSSRV